MFAVSALAFLCFGVMLVLVGANQAVLARELGLDLAGSGMLASSLALGAGVGITVAGPAYDRLRRGEMMAGSALLVALALGSMPTDVTAVGAGLRIAIAGLGAGAYNTVVNASIGERFGARAGRPLAFIHSLATIGAMAGPLLVAWIVARHSWVWSFRLVGAAHLVIAGGALARRADYPPPAAESDDRASRWPSVPALAPFLAVVFAYVAVEGTTTVFAVAYAVDHLGLSEARGQLAISALWLGVLASRLALIASSRPLGPRALAAAGTSGAVVLVSLVAFDLRIVELAFGLIGGAVGLVYPLAMALLGERFPTMRGTAAGLVGGAGAAGAVVVPYLTGVVGDRYGVHRAVASLATWCAVIALGGLWISRRAPDRAAS